MDKRPENTLWFVTGSQHLYGRKTLKQVAEDARAVVAGLNRKGGLPARVIFIPVVTTPEVVHKVCQGANADRRCMGIVAWMHTFSPARMWIAGLGALQKPLLHLHTQFNRDIPWAAIDMDFMNLNQSAHGGREFGHACARLNKRRKVVTGHWQDPEVLERVADWARAARAWHDARGAKIARIGDNMREVAVTEGDKVAAQIKLGYAVNGYGAGDLAAIVNQVEGRAVSRLLAEYKDRYTLGKSLLTEGPGRLALAEAAKIEIGLERFLKAGGFKAFTTTF